MRIHRRGRRATAVATLLSVVTALPPARAGDWPQLWGPTVTGSVDAASPGGSVSLRELWRRPIGSGFSGIAVAGERGYTGESDGTTDQAIAFDVHTGRTLWRVALGETYRGHDGSRDGPIATPAVAAGRVFMASPRGLLVALDAASGRELWRQDLLGEPQVKAPLYGFGSSPIVAFGRVVLQVGGAEKSGLLAFDPASGKLAWSALLSETKGDSAGYTMAVPAEIGGQRQLVVTGHDRVFSVRAEDGALVWSHALPEAEEPTRAPLVLPEDRVLVSRGTSSILLKLTREGGAWKAAEAWRSPRLKGGLSPTVYEGGIALRLRRTVPAVRGRRDRRAALAREDELRRADPRGPPARAAGRPVRASCGSPRLSPRGTASWPAPRPSTRAPSRAPGRATRTDGSSSATSRRWWRTRWSPRRPRLRG